MRRRFFAAVAAFAITAACADVPSPTDGQIEAIAGLVTREAGLRR
jgi:hypothetical protein